MVWAGADTVVCEPVVPLVVYQAPSLSRSIGVQSLEREGRAYRITCVSRGVNGVMAAVRAGLGVAVFARSLMPEDLVELPPAAGLPALPTQDLLLISAPCSESTVTSALTTAILSGVSALGVNPGWCI